LIRNSLGESIDVTKDYRSRWWIVLDASQMETAIINLVINARDAMPNGGKLSLRTEDIFVSTPGELAPEMPPGSYVALIVGDTGIGMDEDILAKALDPFFTTKSVGQGTGLGLSTAYGFVSQSGGYMRIDSAPGKGTTIAMYIPRVAAPSFATADS